MSKLTSPFKSLKTVGVIGFVAGTLDITGAIVVNVVILQRTSMLRILQSIASGIFGKSAYAGGMETALYGLLFHYIIATSWAAAYFFVFPIIPFFRTQKMLSGLLYGVVVWLVMNLVVLPLSNVGQGHFTLQNVLIGLGILIVCIGLPISLITHKYYLPKITQ